MGTPLGPKYILQSYMEPLETSYLALHASTSPDVSLKVPGLRFRELGV